MMALRHLSRNRPSTDPRHSGKRRVDSTMAQVVMLAFNGAFILSLLV